LSEHRKGIPARPHRLDELGMPRQPHALGSHPGFNLDDERRHALDANHAALGGVGLKIQNTI
jgi:hypothetical protein